MCVVLRGFYDHYIRGEAVEKAADNLADRLGEMCVFSQPNEKFTEKQRSTVTSNFLWVTTSAIAIATFANPALTIPVGCTLGGVATVPFVRPLFSSLKTRICNGVEKIACKTKLKSALIFSLFCAAHGGVTYWMSTGMEPKEFVPLSITFSNLTMNGAIEVVKKIIKRDETKRRLSPADEHSPLWQKPRCLESAKSKTPNVLKIIDLTSQIDAHRQRISVARGKIQKLDFFVSSFPELRKICMEEMQAKPHLANFDAIFKPIPPTENPDSIGIINEIQLNTKLQKEANDLEDSLQERIEFIERSKKLKQCFEEHMAKVRSGPQINKVYPQLQVSE